MKYLITPDHSNNSYEIIHNSYNIKNAHLGPLQNAREAELMHTAFTEGLVLQLSEADGAGGVRRAASLAERRQLHSGGRGLTGQLRRRGWVVQVGGHGDRRSSCAEAKWLKRRRGSDSHALVV